MSKVQFGVLITVLLLIASAQFFKPFKKKCGCKSAIAPTEIATENE